MHKKGYFFSGFNLSPSPCVFVSQANAEKEVDGQKIALKVAKVINENKILVDDQTEIGLFNDQPIYAGEVELKKKIYDASGKNADKNDYKIAFKALLKEKHESKLAEEFGIQVTSEEVLLAVESEKEAIYAPENDSIDFFKTYVTELGYTEEEYWQSYRPLQMEKYLIHQKVEKYIQDNKINIQDLSDIKYEIFEEQYKEKLK
jgi:hypothetical protein